MKPPVVFFFKTEAADLYKKQRLEYECGHRKSKSGFHDVRKTIYVRNGQVKAQIPKKKEKTLGPSDTPPDVSMHSY